MVVDETHTDADHVATRRRRQTKRTPRPRRACRAGRALLWDFAAVESKSLCSACVCRCASPHVHVYVCAREAAYTAMAEEDLWVAYIDSQRDNVGYKFILRVVVEIY